MKTSCFSILLFCAAHHTAARYLRSQEAIDVAQNPVGLVASTPVDDINDGHSPFSSILVLNEYQSAEGDTSLEDFEDVGETLLDDKAVEDSHDFLTEASVVRDEEDVGVIDDLVDPTLISAANVPVAGGEGDLDDLLDEIHDISDDQIDEDTLIDLEDKLHEAIEDPDDTIDEEHGSIEDTLDEDDGDIQVDPIDDDVEVDPIVDDDDVQVDPVVEVDVVKGQVNPIAQDSGDIQVDPIDDDVEIDPIVDDDLAVVVDEDDLPDNLPVGLLSDEQAN